MGKANCKTAYATICVRKENINKHIHLPIFTKGNTGKINQKTVRLVTKKVWIRRVTAVSDTSLQILFYIIPTFRNMLIFYKFKKIKPAWVRNGWVRETKTESKEL